MRNATKGYYWFRDSKGQLPGNHIGYYDGYLWRFPGTNRELTHDMVDSIFLEFLGPVEDFKPNE